MAKTIEFTLDSASISKAIKEVEAYAEWIQQKLSELARILTEDQGIPTVVMEIAALGAIDKWHELSDSIDAVYYPETHVGIISANAPHAFFVEYGTGIVGANSEPHPTGEGWDPPPVKVGKYGPYTKHDTNNRGDAGWLYISEHDGKLHWTRGKEARPFMYGAFVELERKSRQLAKEIFNR